MFRIFYTTQMSSNARQLQTRFAKMRSKNGRVSKIMAAVMAVAIVMVMATATVVMAAVGSNGLEYWTHDEYYPLASMKFSFDVDMEKQPQWVSEITDDGHINAIVQLGELRSANGYVEDDINVTLIGNKDTKTLFSKSMVRYLLKYIDDLVPFDETWINGSWELVGYYFSEDADLSSSVNQPEVCIVIGFNEDNTEVRSVALKCYDSQDANYHAALLDDYEDFSLITADKIEGKEEFMRIRGYQNRPSREWFTYYENLGFINRKVDGIDISIVEATENGVKIKADIKHSGIDYINYEMYPVDYSVDNSGSASGHYELPMSETFTLVRQHRDDSNNLINEKWEKGKTYIVDFVCGKGYYYDESKTSGYGVNRYRQREYVTVK